MTSRHQWQALTAFTAFAAVGTVACQTLPAPIADVPTITISTLIPTIEQHRGQTVRTCGRLDQRQSGGMWILIDPKAELDTFHGPPRLGIAACDGNQPQLDGAGCIVGRVARRDGSTEFRSHRIRTSAPTSHEWFLHPLCPR